MLVLLLLAKWLIFFSISLYWITTHRVTDWAWSYASSLGDIGPVVLLVTVVINAIVLFVNYQSKSPHEKFNVLPLAIPTCYIILNFCLFIATIFLGVAIDNSTI